VIKSFRSKALRLFAANGDPSRLPIPNHRRVRQILALLDTATRPEDMNVAGLRFHGLQGKPKRYAVDASGNYRVTFGWEEKRAVDVDIEDYH
jgi:proteic killer suppression protein